MSISYEKTFGKHLPCIGRISMSECLEWSPIVFVLGPAGIDQSVERSLVV